jgi:4-hydroxymandelate oxidase
MSPQFDRATTRRRFVQFLAACPLFTHSGAPAFAQNTSTPARLPDPMVWVPRELDNPISDPKEALDVFDFEPVAKRNVPPAHFGCMVTGIDDEVTLRTNRDGFIRFQLRPRRRVMPGPVPEGNSPCRTSSARPWGKLSQPGPLPATGRYPGSRP